MEDYYCSCGFNGTKEEVEKHRTESKEPECTPYTFGDRTPAKSSSSVTTFSSTKDKGRSI